MQALTRRPLASVLLAGGVTLVVAALLIAEAIAESGRLSTVQELRTMGANVIVVSAEASQNRGGRARTAGVVTTLTLRDSREIATSIPGIFAISPEYRGLAPLKFGDLARQANVSGVDAGYAALRDAPMAQGSFFDQSEANSAQRVAVLGAQLAHDLVGDDNAIGSVLWVRGIPFRIIGVLPPRGVGVDAFDEDGVAFIPLRTAQRRLFQVDYIQRIFVRVDERRMTLLDASGAITSLLRVRHRAPVAIDKTGSVRPDFRVETQLRLVDMLATAERRLRVFELGVAILLLVSGAAGTFALQFLAVRDRRIEVGTRRALGAKAREIFLQFLTEAGVASISGGAAGICLAWMVAGIRKVPLGGILGVIVFITVVASCICAASVPAWRAACLQPAEALRGL